MPASLSNTSSSSRVPATGIGVRRANRNDLPAIARLEQDSFTTDRMSERQWRRHLDSPSAEVQVAIRDRRVVGAALVFYRRRSNLARVYSIAVAAAQRGVGIGALLLDAVEQSARQRGLRRLRLEVRVDNVAAKRLYEQRGFTAFGVHTAYYEDGADATRYQKALAETT
ncbi:MAG: ribosomal protein S18-alanine N-acetyltransferase [Dokdonella sp.]|uniref:ribosomal protein S18-alanine N-acetyltransferase n=1 Tax=Dokdonella sp. TaxID=2291710 RepID=UPI0032673460